MGRCTTMTTRKALNRGERRGLPQRALRKASSIWMACGLLGASALAQVTFERLVRNSAKEPQNWMTYSGDYSKRFSALDQINLTNAQHLVAKWVYQTGGRKARDFAAGGRRRALATAQDDRAFALDARTGRPIWSISGRLPCGYSSVLRACQSRAGDARTTKFLSELRCARDCSRRQDWQRRVGRYCGRLSHGVQQLTLAPLAVRGSA